MAKDPTTFVPASVPLECQWCGKIVAAAVVSQYAYFEDGPDVPVRYLFVRCPACNNPMVARQENDGDWNDDRDFSEPVRYLPAPSRAGSAVPPAVAQAFEEATKCLSVGAYSAAAVMCRKTIDAVIAEHQIKARHLSEGLKLMRDQGLIEPRLFEWADALRLTGNRAAHDAAVSISRVDARDMIDFTSAIIEYVFTFRDRFEAFQSRRRSKSAAN